MTASTWCRLRECKDFLCQLLAQSHREVDGFLKDEERVEQEGRFEGEDLVRHEYFLLTGFFKRRACNPICRLVL